MKKKQDIEMDLEKILNKALESNKVTPPSEITNGILKKAQDALDRKKLLAPNNDIDKIVPFPSKKQWAVPTSIAASLLVGFLFGSWSPTQFSNDSIIIADPAQIIFQGDSNNEQKPLFKNIENASEEQWLRVIAEKALLGEVDAAQTLIKAYKVKFPKENPK